MKQEEKEQLVKAICTSTEMCGRILLPAHFERPLDEPHYKLLSVMDSPSKKKVIAAPRGTGKTTWTMAFCLRKLLSLQARYLVYVGASQDSAIEQTENLKRELTTNENILYLFGDVRTESFSQEKWDVNICGNKSRVLPIGPINKIRGRKIETYRPDLIVMDDIENDENILSDDQRRKLRSWVFSALLNSVDRHKPWQALLIGTMLHNDSLLAHLLDSERTKGWERLRISLCDAHYNSNFPQFMSSEEVKQLAEEYIQMGELSTFAREFMNEPMAEADLVFKKAMFKHYDEATADLNTNPDVVNVVLIDPAKTISQGSCSTAIVCVGINIANPAMYVRSVQTMKVTPHELFEAALATCDAFNSRLLAVEVTGLDSFITQPLNSYLARAGRFDIHLQEVKPRDKKEKRAGALLPYYKRGLVYHNRDTCATLESRLQQWPRPTTWDELDAFAHIIPVMDEADLYFDEVNKDILESQYAAFRAEDQAMAPLPPPLY